MTLLLFHRESKVSIISLRILNRRRKTILIEVLNCCNRRLPTRSIHIKIYYCINTQDGHTLGVIHIGAPACGMNAAVRSFVRNAMFKGDTVMGIHDGIEGLIDGNFKPLGIIDL